MSFEVDPKSEYQNLPSSHEIFTLNLLILNQMDCVLEGRQDLYEGYTLGPFIARGLNQVYELINKTTNQVLCAKLVHISTTNDLESFRKEISFLEATLHHPHPNIISYEGYYIHEERRDKFNSFKTGYIIMEKGKTNLDHYLQKRIKFNQHFSAQELVQFMGSMLAAHSHLQNINIAHRDIKPENILMFDEANMLFKICDVGVGTESRGENTKTRTLIGTVTYLSPELYQAHRDFKQKQNYNPYKSDVFSLGLVFLYFGTLHRFDSKHRNDLTTNEKYKTYLRSLIRELKIKYPEVYGLSKIMKAMLNFDENQRVDFNELKHLIVSNNYLELKHSSQDQSFLITRALGMYTQYAEIASPKDLSNFEIQPMGPHYYDIKFNNLNRSPNEVQAILEEFKTKFKNVQLKGLIMNLELNNLELQHIKPMIEIIEKSTNIDEIKLFLWNNNLRNEGLIHTIQAIGKSLELHSLHLSFSANSLTDVGVNQCIPELSKLRNLREMSLDLGMNRLSVECAESIFKILFNFQELENLQMNLETNNLNLLISKLLQEGIKSLAKLTRLHINFSNNILQDQGLYDLGDSLEKLHHCTLVLWNCGIKDKGITEFSKALTNCKLLESLDLILWNNKISEKGCQELAEALEPLKITELQLNLSNNKITDKGVRVISKSVETLVNLKILKLHFDNVEGSSVACRYIARILTKLVHLQTLNLNLRGNEIDVEGSELLNYGFCNAFQLQHLSLNMEHTKVGDTGMKNIIKGIGKCKQIETIFINFQDSGIDGDGPLVIFELLPGWKYLEEVSLDLRKNPIGEDIQSEVKLSLENLHAQVKVELRFNEKKQKL